MTSKLIGARVTYRGTGNTYTVARPGQDCLVLERPEPYKKMLVKAKTLLRMEKAGAVRIEHTTEEDKMACRECGGSGKRRCPGCKGTKYPGSCARCKGVRWLDCPACDGTGAEEDA